MLIRDKKGGQGEHHTVKWYTNGLLAEFVRSKTLLVTTKTEAEAFFDSSFFDGHELRDKGGLSSLIGEHTDGQTNRQGQRFKELGGIPRIPPTLDSGSRSVRDIANKEKKALPRCTGPNDPENFARKRYGAEDLRLS